MANDLKSFYCSLMLIPCLGGSTPGTIWTAVQQVINPRRIRHLPGKPLHAVEMVCAKQQVLFSTSHMIVCALGCAIVAA
jgi:hypothetical protein